MKNYVVLATVCLGTVISAYLSSCINIALPNIMAALNFNNDSIVWVSLSYLLPYGSMLPLTGKLGDKYGAKLLYVLGLTIFTLGSFLCGTASNATSMIVYRIIQGIGGGLLLPNAMTIVALTFTGSSRAMALGIWSAMTAIGAAVGPTVGGYLIELFHWRSIFFSAVPLAAIGILSAYFIIPKIEASKHIRIDFIGSILMILSIGAMLVALNQGEKEGWTHSYYIVSLLYLSAASFFLFILVESKVESPVVDLTLFKNLNFTFANIISGIIFFALQGSTYLLPFFLKSILGYDSVSAGIMLLPQTSSMVLASFLSGRLNTLLGPRVLTFTGLSLVTYSFYLLIDINTSFGAYNFFVPLAIFGLGMGLTMSPLTNCAIATLQRSQIGSGSGVLNCAKLICGSIGVVIVQVVLTRREVYHNYLLNSSLQAGTDPGTIRLFIDYLNSRNFFGSVFDVGAAVQHWTVGMHILPEEYAKFMQVLASTVSKQAAVLSFQDDFFILATISFVGLLLTLFLKSHRSA